MSDKVKESGKRGHTRSLAGVEHQQRINAGGKKKKKKKIVKK
jgi:hypothetical protein